MQTRRADLISLTLGSTGEGFAVQDGRSTGTLTVQVLPAGFAQPVPMTIYAGTPGEVTCEDIAKACALVAQTLGDTVSWFALVPLAAGFKIQLPAVEKLDAGYAHLVNGWEVPVRPGHRPPLRLARRVLQRVPAPRAEPHVDLRPRPRRADRRHLLTSRIRNSTAASGRHRELANPAAQGRAATSMS